MESRIILSTFLTNLSYYLSRALASATKSSTKSSNSKALTHSPRISRTVIPPDRKEWTYNRVFTNIRVQNLSSATTNNLNNNQSLTN
jgi:hypothetical protein